MKAADCVFDLTNDSAEDICLYLEPECIEFQLPPGKSVQVRLFGADHPVDMKHSVGPNGEKTISFWSHKGDYQVIFEGRDIWDLL
jgi:hypothetical protein